jgi:hypothetical protein
MLLIPSRIIITAIDARRRAIILDIPTIVPFPRRFIMRSALMNDIQIMKRLRSKDRIVGIIP